MRVQKRLSKNSLQGPSSGRFPSPGDGFGSIFRYTQKSYLWLLPLALFLAGLVGVGLVASTSVPLAAAQPARALISPATSTVNAGQVITLEVYIENVASLWAGQVALHFDPAVVQVVGEDGSPATQIQRGTLLNPARVTEYVNVVNNTAGIIEYAATLRNDPRRPVPPASGSGSFARISFKGIGAGTSPLAFSTEGTTYVHEIKFVDGDLEEFTLPLEDGSLTVGAGQDIYLPLLMRNHGVEPARLDRMIIDKTARNAARAAAIDALLAESVVLTAGSPRDVVVAGDDIVFRIEKVEVPGPECEVDEPALPPDHCLNKILRFNADINPHHPLVVWRGDDLSPGRLAVADGYVYFANYDLGDDAILRIPIDGGDVIPVGDADFVRGEPGHGLAKSGNLVLDGEWIYFGDWDGIRRMRTTDGRVETLAAGHLSLRVAVDDAYVYWTETFPDGIWRVSKSGGAAEEMATDEQLYLPFDIALDEDYVYWTESGGLARRMDKEEPFEIHDYGERGTWDTGDIAVDASHVYWLDELRLKRAARDGDRVEVLEAALCGPRGLNATGIELIWGEGALARPDCEAHAGIWRLPLADAEEVVYDFRVTAIEVNQAVQNLDNDVPLVEDKTTYVRVYAEVEPAFARDVAANLQARRLAAGRWESLGTLESIQPVNVGRGGAERTLADRAAGRTLNFLLPADWLHGSVEFEAEVNMDGAIREDDFSDNTLSVGPFEFQSVAPPCVEMVVVETVPVSASADAPGYADIVDWFRRVYPVPDVRLRWGGSVRNEEGEPFDFVPYLSVADFAEDVRIALTEYDAVTSDVPGCTEGSTHYYGMVHEEVFEAEGFGPTGWGSALRPDGTPSHRAGGTMSTSLHTLIEFGWIDASPYDWGWFSPGGLVLAHELAHNWGVLHVDCGPVIGPDTIDHDYPYDTCNLGPDDDPDGYVGFDALTQRAILPTDAADLMSYGTFRRVEDRDGDGEGDKEGKPQWISDYTYRNLLDLPLDTLSHAAPARAADVADALAQAEETLAVWGVIGSDGSSGRLRTVMRVPEGLISQNELARLAAEQPTGPGSRYALRQLGADGTTLRELLFDPLPMWVGPDPAADGGAFFIATPFVPETARLVLARGALTLAERNVSLSAPTVRVVKPNGGEDITAVLTIEWEASDPDNDPLSYMVQYSPDAGTSWQVLELKTDATSLVLDDLSLLPGSDAALVRVVANDGVNAATDVSDATFRVAVKAPTARIAQPLDGAVYPAGEQVVARGDGYDAEDGGLGSSATQWLVDGTPVGTGRDVAIAGLAPGAHIVRLQVVDSDQMTGVAEVTIYVEPPLCQAAGALDVVFLLDTSPDMAQHLDSACRTIQDTAAALRSRGLDVRHRAFGISQATACARQSVREWLPGSAVNHPSDWGVAVREVSAGHEWTDEAARVIVPITNQGPENGNPVQDPGPDRDAIAKASAAARAGRVTVMPLLMPSEDEQAAPAVRRLADSLAKATGGEVIEWARPDHVLATELGRLAPGTGCRPSIDGISPVCGFDAQATLTLFGENLAVGTQVYVGDLPARDVMPNSDGTQITFKLPAGLRSGRTYDVRVERPGVGSDTLSGALTNGPCSDRCDDFQPGDIQLPMWNLRGDGAEITFQALASGNNLTARLYAHNGPMKLLVQEGDGTPITSVGVLAGATGEISVPTTPGRTYLVLARNAQSESTRFRLLVRGAGYLRTADDGDDWMGGVNPGRGEDHGAMSHPELGFAGRWSELGPEFATTVWYFNVESGTNELAARVWGEDLSGNGHAGMEWILPNGLARPLVGPEGPSFDHTWRVRNPEPGFWALRLKAGRSDTSPGGSAQAYSLARLDGSADDWLYFRTEGMVGPPCGPSVTLDPPEGNICLDDIFRMDIVVSDVANLYGAEVHLIFDPAMLEVVDAAGTPAFEIVPGPFLDPAQGILGLNSADNEGGFIDYAVTLKDPAPPAFGTGVLASVYFRAKATGTTTVQFDQVKLSEKPEPPAPGKPITAEFRDAAFQVNECFAPGQAAGALSGQVWLDGRLSHSGAEVGAEPGGRLVLTLPDGGFELPALTAGNYTVDVRKTSYLRAGERNFTVAGGATLALPNVTLLGGDCNNSGTIDITDGAIASASFAFSTGQAGFDARADINGDGVVDIFDLVMVGNNFGCLVDDSTARCQRWGRQ